MPRLKSGRVAAPKKSISPIASELALLARTLDYFARRSDLYRDLDRSGYVLALTLDAEGPQTISALADALGLDGTTVTRQVAAMERQALVRHDSDPADGRAVVITLTPHGRAQMLAVSQIRDERYSETLAEWSDDEKTLFADLLQKFNMSIHDRAPRPRRR